MPSPTDRPSPKELQTICLPAIQCASEARGNAQGLIGTLDHITAKLRLRGVDTARLDAAAKTAQNAVQLLYSVAEDIRLTAVGPKAGE